MTARTDEPGLAAWWRSRAPYLLSLLRIVAAFLFMQVGTAKLFAFPGAIMPDGGTAPLASLPRVAGALETFAGDQSGNGCGPLLLSLALPVRRGCGALEHRRGSGRDAAALTPAAMRLVRSIAVLISSFGAPAPGIAGVLAFGIRMSLGAGAAGFSAWY